MHYKIEHRDHRKASAQIGGEGVELPDLDRAERESFRTLCHEAADDPVLHADASIIIRDDDGVALSVICIHATVKRL